MSQYQEFIKDGKRSGNVVFAPVSLSVGLRMLYQGVTRDDICRVSGRHTQNLYIKCDFRLPEHAGPLQRKLLGTVDFQTAHNLFVSRVFHHVSLEFDEGLVSSDGTHNLFVSRVFHHVSLEFDEGLMSSDGTHNLFVSLVFHNVSLEFDEGLMSSDGTHNLFVSRVFHHVSLEFDEGLMSSDGTHNLFVSCVFHHVSLEFDEGLISPDGTHNLFVSHVFHHMSLEFDEGLMSSDSMHNLRHVQPVRVTCLHVSLEFDEGLKSSACQTTEGAHEILDLDNGQIDRMFCTDYPFMFFIISEQTGAILQIGRILRPTLIY
ncbi:hypothetical protein LSAT2_003727 [Lamellibrachia satsuma]|nr:hypothetical protein LSAT2_003727 [Lamellibrachia satsuma]